VCFLILELLVVEELCFGIVSLSQRELAACENYVILILLMQRQSTYHFS
jgi:hypothetical protein